MSKKNYYKAHKASRKHIDNRIKSTARANRINIKIFILPQDLLEFLDFAETLVVNPKNPHGEILPYFSDNEITEIRRMAKLHLESDDADDKAITAENDVNLKSLDKKLTIAQNLFWARFIEEDGKRLFSDEEVQKLIDYLPSKKRIRNDFLMERYDMIYSLACQIFLVDMKYQERLDKSEKNKEEREKASQEALEESRKEKSKILRKADKKIKAAEEKLQSEREKHTEELSKFSTAFAEERDKLLAEIEALKTERDTLSEANILLKNDEIALKKQLDSESGRANNLEAKSANLEKTNQELLEKLKDVVPREDFDKIQEKLTNALSEKITLKSKINKLIKELADLQQSPQMLFFDTIIDAVASRTQGLISQELTEFGARFTNLEAIVKGQQTFISKLSAPQTEKQVRDEAEEISKLEKVEASLLEQGYSKEEVATLASKRIAYFGDMGSDFGGFNSFWKVLNSQSEFFSVEDYEGKDIDREIEASRFDFVILSRNRSHGNHSYQMSNFDNPKLIDFAHYTVSSRMDAVDRILKKAQI